VSSVANLLGNGLDPFLEATDESTAANISQFAGSIDCDDTDRRCTSSVMSRRIRANSAQSIALFGELVHWDLNGSGAAVDDDALLHEASDSLRVETHSG